MFFSFMQKVNLPAKLATRNGDKKIFGKNCQLTLWIPLEVKIFTEITLFHIVSKIKCILAFYAEVQDGHQKWRENNFWKEIPDDFADNLEVKNLVEITLSCTISQINAFLHFLQNIKMADKYGGIQFLAKTGR